MNHSVEKAVVHLGGISAGEVRAAALSNEQRVAGGDVALEDVQDAVLRVPRSVDDLELETARRNRVAVVDRHVLIQRRDPVGDHLRAGPLSDVLVPGDMVRMAVGVRGCTGP